ncbi:hypothetical protein [Paenisporosarcina sp. TG-14]|uniref:hypothetical protein n=1 Tax=Paenisporosarcina sp. TG-14 TaxID=1231057 RepID=UPI0012DF80F3|nr:hypothetical protein [Paenisporosarcina sp. TG-14]
MQKQKQKQEDAFLGWPVCLQKKVADFHCGGRIPGGTALATYSRRSVQGSSARAVPPGKDIGRMPVRPISSRRVTAGADVLPPPPFQSVCTEKVNNEINYLSSKIKVTTLPARHKCTLSIVLQYQQHSLTIVFIIDHWT